MKKNNFYIKFLLTALFIIALLLSKEGFVKKQNILAQESLEKYELNVVVVPLGAGKIKITSPENIENAIGLNNFYFSPGQAKEITVEVAEIYPGFVFDFWSILEIGDQGDAEPIYAGESYTLGINNNATLAAYFKIDQEYIDRLFPKYPERLKHIIEEVGVIAEEIETAIQDIEKTVDPSYSEDPERPTGCSCSNMQSICVPDPPRTGTSTNVKAVGVFGDPCTIYTREEIIGKRIILQSTYTRLSYFKSLLNQELAFLDKELKTLPENIQTNITDTIKEFSQDNGIIDQLMEKNNKALEESVFDPVKNNCTASCEKQTNLSYQIVACIGLGSGEQKPIELDWLIKMGLKDLEFGDISVSGFNLNLPKSMQAPDLTLPDFYLNVSDLVINFPEIKLSDIEANRELPTIQDLELNINSKLTTLETPNINLSVDNLSNIITREGEINQEVFAVEVDQRWYWDNFNWLFNKCFNELHEDFLYTFQTPGDENPILDEPDNLTCENRTGERIKSPCDLFSEERQIKCQNIPPCLYIQNDIQKDLCNQATFNEDYEILKNSCSWAFSGDNSLINACKEGIELMQCLSEDSEDCYEIVNCQTECGPKEIECNNLLTRSQLVPPLATQEQVDQCKEELNNCYSLYSLERSLTDPISEWPTGSNVGYCSNVDKKDLGGGEMEVAEYTFKDCQRLWENAWSEYWPYYRFGHSQYTVGIIGNRFVSGFLGQNAPLYYRAIIEGNPKPPILQLSYPQESPRLRRIINIVFPDFEPKNTVKEIGIPSVCLSENNGIDRPELRSYMSLERECKNLLGDDSRCQLEIECTIPKTKKFWPDYFKKLDNYLNDWSCFSEADYELNIRHREICELSNEELYYPTVSCYTSPKTGITNTPCQDIYCDLTGQNISTNFFPKTNDNLGFTQSCNNFYIRQQKRTRLWDFLGFWFWGSWLFPEWEGPFSLDKHFLEDYMSEKIGVEPFCQATEESIKRIKEAMWGAVIPTEEKINQEEIGYCEEIKDETKETTLNDYQEKALENLNTIVTNLNFSPVQKAEISVCSSKYSNPQQAILIECTEKRLTGQTPLPIQCNEPYTSGTQESCGLLLGGKNTNLLTLNNALFVKYGDPQKALSVVCRENRLVDEDLCAVIDPPPDPCNFFHLLTKGEYREKPKIEISSSFNTNNVQQGFSQQNFSDLIIKSAPKISFPAIRIPDIIMPRFTLMPFF
ncbi:MAG: hypothetical protein PHN37_02915, partial [Candidatus Pacebacteria bacterium]|nr:hypothetical protein [Candidatus Paceibacterota bacterium]